jgi:hypothetical protein
MGLLTRSTTRLLAPVLDAPSGDHESRVRSATASLTTSLIGLCFTAGLIGAAVLSVNFADSMDQFDNFLVGCGLYALTPLSFILPLVALVSGSYGLKTSQHRRAVVGIALGAAQLIAAAATVWWLLYGSAVAARM